MTEVEKLQALLNDMGGKLLHVERGEKWNSTPVEERARTIREALERIIDGDYEVVSLDEDC